MKLTHDNLIRLDFRGEGKDFLNRPCYRLKIPPPNPYNFHYELQIVIADYALTNPNSGILSIYDRGVKDAHMFTQEKKESEKKKIDFLLHDDAEYKIGIKYITIPDREISIAWHVSTLERLNEIYTALTGNPPLKIRKIKYARKTKTRRNTVS